MYLMNLSQNILMYRPGDFITKGFPVPDSVKQNGNQLDLCQR